MCLCSVVYIDDLQFPYMAAHSDKYTGHNLLLNDVSTFVLCQLALFITSRRGVMFSA